MTTGEPVVSLPQYEGPLDLLLDLVRTHRLDILDLPIAEVTRQYLDYIRRAHELNIDLGGDFILMAATLILIKSRTLLKTDLEEEPDPRQELVEQLLTREQAQQAAALLAERLQAASDAWSPGAELNLVREGAIQHDTTPPPPDPRPTMNLLDVLRVAKIALATARAHRLLNLKRDPVTLEDMMRWLGRKLKQLNSHQALTCTELFAAQATVENRVALFMAILEMARTQKLHLHQQQFLAPIQVFPGAAPPSFQPRQTWHAPPHC